MLQTTNDRTFGVELELFGITARRAEQVLGAVDIAVENEVQSYNHRITPYWKIVPDRSITGNDGSAGIELVSPILRGAGGLAQVDRVITALAAHGGQVNDTCGVHVHHEAQHLSIDAMKSLFLRYAKGEFLLDAAAGRSDTFYTQSLLRRADYDMPALFQAIHRASNLHALIEAVRGPHGPNCLCTAGQRCKCDVRYCHLNLGQYWRQGTVEFRQHKGCLEVMPVLGWICLTQSLVQQATDTVPSRMKAQWYDATTYSQHLKLTGFGGLCQDAQTYYKPIFRAADAPDERIRVAA